MLANGTAGQILKSRGTTLSPEWGTESVSINGLAKGLDCKTNTASPLDTVDVIAAELLVKNSSGAVVLLSTVSVSPNIAVSGVNGLDTGTESANAHYAVWVIYNGTTVAGLLSLSYTAPTMPSGYTHKALVSSVRNNASTFLPYHQRGDYYQYKDTQLALAAGSATAITAIDISPLVPSIAKSVSMKLEKTSPAAIGGYHGTVYAGSSVSAQVAITVTAVSAGVNYAYSSGELMLDWPAYSPNISYSNSSGNLSIYINGFRLTSIGAS